MTDNQTPRLIAIRQAMGLNMTELAELPAIPQSNRVISNYERGVRPPSTAFAASMNEIARHYRLLLSILLFELQNINLLRFYVDSADQPAPKPILPYFDTFEDFVANTGNESPSYWRVWQAVLNHLVITNIIDVSNDFDEHKIPPSFENTFLWLNNHYE